MGSILATLIYFSAFYGLPVCFLLSGLGALVRSKQYKSTFLKLLSWSIAGMTIAVGAYGLFVLFMVYGVQNPAYQGQGLGYVLAVPILLAPLGALIGGLIQLIWLLVATHR
jgi:hypothetical protein